MESHGVPGKIQVSEASAELLRAAGKSHWLTAREDLIAAKGKGTLQTYWLQVASITGTAGSHHSSASQNWGDTPSVPDHRRMMAATLQEWESEDEEEYGKQEF